MIDCKKSAGIENVSWPIDRNKSANLHDAFLAPTVHVRKLVGVHKLVDLATLFELGLKPQGLASVKFFS